MKPVEYASAGGADLRQPLAAGGRTVVDTTYAPAPAPPPPRARVDPKTQLWLTLLAFVVVWAVGGTLFFHFQQHWELAEALFYSINVGLGVGYGQFVVNGAPAKWFVVFYCMAGASLIASAGALVVQSVLDRQDTINEEEGTRYRAEARRQSGFARKLKSIHQYRFKLVVFGGWMFWVALGVAFGMSGRLKLPRCSDPLGQCSTFTEAVFFVITSMSTASQVPPRRCIQSRNATERRENGACQIGCKAPDPKSSTAAAASFSFNSATCQTQIGCIGSCETDRATLALTAMYIFVGIPLFASIMGFLADVYISRFQRRQARKMASEEITDRNFAQMTMMNVDMAPRSTVVEGGVTKTVPWYMIATESGDKVVYWGDFLEYKLRKLDVVDRKLLATIKRDFRTTDKQGKGYLVIDDVG